MFERAATLLFQLAFGSLLSAVVVSGLDLFLLCVCGLFERDCTQRAHLILSGGAGLMPEHIVSWFQCLLCLSSDEYIVENVEHPQASQA